MAVFFATQGNARALKDVPGPGGRKYLKGTVIDASGFNPRLYALLVEQGSIAPTNEAVTTSTKKPKPTPTPAPTPPPVETTEDSDVPSF